MSFTTIPASGRHGARMFVPAPASRRLLDIVGARVDFKSLWMTGSYSFFPTKFDGQRVLQVSGKDAVISCAPEAGIPNGAGSVNEGESINHA